MLMLPGVVVIYSKKYIYFFFSIIIYLIGLFGS